MDDRLLLLGLLRQSEMHGYQLYEFIERNLTTCTNLKKPSAYFLLSKMEAEGLVEVQETRTGNRPPRKVYRLTPEGERLFWQSLEENLAQFIPTVFVGDVGLAFLDQLPSQRALDLLQRRQAAMQMYLAKLEALPPHRGSAALLIQHQIHHVRSELAWLASLIADLQSASQSAALDEKGLKALENTRSKSNPK
ncbi:MAG: PadR family transcriptional regulator [Anaerolineae bacterium]|jgi:DNA-binding PadR family transcriptional regulator|nr:MAG: PadR family transcriptional regulator [Anaerolineae bacterium]